MATDCALWPWFGACRLASGPANDIVCECLCVNEGDQARRCLVANQSFAGLSTILRFAHRPMQPTPRGSLRVPSRRQPIGRVRRGGHSGGGHRRRNGCVPRRVQHSHPPLSDVARARCSAASLELRDARTHRRRHGRLPRRATATAFFSEDGEGRAWRQAALAAHSKCKFSIEE